MVKDNTKYIERFDLDQGGLYFIPLGGSEEFGMNLNVYICDGQYLLVDCGIGFADERLPGIDIVLPDPAFLDGLEEDKIAALIITHAHEDHVGAVPYLWKRFKCPIYTTRFTKVVLSKKFEERKIKDAFIDVIEPLSHIEIGSFKVQFVPVAHSIPDTSSLIIETDYGRVVHSGDWNMDSSPVIGAMTEAAPFKAASEKGVLAYIGDSTNAEVSGHSRSESDVEIGLETEFKKCNGKIAITIFSSNIGRIISICRAAQKCGRDVGVIGHSLHKMIASAQECGFLDGIPDFVDDEDLAYLPDEKMVVILTGSQGEYRAALARVARRNHRSLSLNKNDTVIFSSRAIPGNDKNINIVKNNLSSCGINIVTQSDTDSIIHVSGHPCRDDVLKMINWIKPEIVVPVHGERMQIEAHALLAKESKVKNIIIPSNGSVIKLAPEKADIVGFVETGVLAVDLKRIIKIDHQSIVQRRKLQYSGAVHLSIVIDEQGDVVGEPKIDMIGLIEVNSAEIQIEDNLFDEVQIILDDMTKEDRLDERFVSEKLRIAVRRFIFHVLGVKPKTIIHVMQV